MAHQLELSYNWRRRVTAPVALLTDGRSTLFAWILAQAPTAELDTGSQRTVERLQSKGLLA